MTLENISIIGAVVTMALVIAVRMVTLRLLERIQETVRLLRSQGHQRFQDYKRRRLQREMVDQKRLSLLRRKVALRKEIIALRRELEGLRHGETEKDRRVTSAKGAAGFSREKVVELFAQRT